MPTDKNPDTTQTEKKEDKQLILALALFQTNQGAFNRHLFANTSERYFTGTLLGALFAHIAACTGVLTAAHEAGHGILGYRLTSDYPKGTGPTYWIAGFEKFQKMTHAKSFGEGLVLFLKWLFVPNTDTVGLTHPTSHYHPNAIADHIGQNGTDAWVSIAGPLTELLIETACVMAGMALREKYPVLGSGLISFGVINSVLHCSYAWSAIANEASMVAEAERGHDFANFALKMHQMTGINTLAIAITTALLWTGFVPLVALGMYLYQRSKRIHIIPDEVALKHWMMDALNDEKKKAFLEKQFADYQEKNPIIEEKNKWLYDFLAYLIHHLPPESLNASKKAVLEQWQKAYKPKPIEKILNYALFASVLTSTTIQIMNLFAQTTTPALLPAVLILKMILPFLGLLSIARGVYEVYQDFSVLKNAPTTAKALGIAKLAITTTMVACMIAASFVPGLQWLMIPAIMLGALLTVIFSYAKTNVMAKSYAASQQFFVPPETTQQEVSEETPLLKTAAA